MLEKIAQESLLIEDRKETRKMLEKITSNLEKENEREIYHEMKHFLIAYQQDLNIGINK